LAMIAIPQFAAPGPLIARLRGVATSPHAAVAAAAVLLVAAGSALVSFLGPLGGASGAHATLGKAPRGWHEALKAPHGHVVSHDVIRLSARPLAPMAAPTWNAAAPSPTQAWASGPLPAAPIAGFFAPGPGGPLPIIAADGRTPFQAYARPFQSNGRPKVALVIGGLGLNARATQQAIETLPGPVTLSFVPYAEGLQGWIDLARQHGHEVLLETPMEPENYPDNDPGPYTLMARGGAQETAKKLEWVLSRATGYFGLTNYLGSRFLAEPAAYEAFAAAARARGLGFIDDGSAAASAGGLPRASAAYVVDDQLTAKAVDDQLLRLEARALQKGQALGSGFAYPVTLEKVAAWAASVEARGYQLAPASALATRR
jgi:polysaccharide deacetylase 2 family uncharacterized protein YibQ